MPTTSPTATAPLTRWRHTGVHAPFLLTSSDYRERETDARVAFTATLHHPQLGPVGTIADTGNGGPAHFIPSDPAAFPAEELDAFVRASRQDDTPFLDGPEGVGQLLCAVLDETEAAHAVDAIRGTGKLLVRGFLPTHNPRLPSQRDQPRAIDAIPLTIEDRVAWAKALFDTVDPEFEGAGLYWEMFNGREWTPLVAPTSPDVVDADTLLAEVAPIVAEVAPTVAEGAPIVNAGPVETGALQGMYVNFRMVGGSAELRLIGDRVPVLNLDRWCDCHGTGFTEVCFHVVFPEGCQASGTVHAEENCRSLRTFA